MVTNPDGERVEYFSAIPSAPDLAPAGSAWPLLPVETWTAASVTFTLRGGLVALQNPNPVPIDVILQTRASSQISDQTTVTIPPGELQVFEKRSVFEVRAFASLPFRMLGMGFAFILPGSPFFLIDGPYLSTPPLQQLTASPAMANFSWQTGTAVPAPASVAVSPADYSSSSFHFEIGSSGSPFSVTASQNRSPATLTISVNPVGLSPGVYTGSLVVTPEGPNAVATTIPLSLTVSTPPLLVVDPPSLLFGGPAKYGQPLNVASNGSALSIAASVEGGIGTSWLTVSPSSATTPARFTVNVDSTKLIQGDYSGQIAIVGPTNTVRVPIQLKVQVSQVFNFSPPSLTFSVRSGSPPPPSKTLLVGGVVAFATSTASGGSWLSVSFFGAGQLIVSVNPVGLAAGTYAGKVTLMSPPSLVSAEVPVTLVIWNDEPKVTVMPSAILFTELVEAQPPFMQSLEVESGGVPLEFTVSSKFLAAPMAYVTPASIPLVSDSGGSLGFSEYDLTITAGAQKIVIPVTTVVTASPLAPPALRSIVNAASQIAGSIAPGEILTIRGSGVGPSFTAGLTLNPAGTVATSLNGAEVLFDGHPAPIVYGSPFQVNVIVPYEVANQSTTSISVQSAGVASASWDVPVAAAAPAIFTVDSSGVGQAAVLNQDGSVNSAAHPASRGSVIQIYATGEGQTSPPESTGSVIGTTLKTPVLPVKVRIDGVDAGVRYAGSAGGSISGLFQVNAVVPPSIQLGKAVPIVVSVGGASSQGGVTIFVQ